MINAKTAPSSGNSSGRGASGAQDDLMPVWSFVIPVYGSPESLEPLCSRIKKSCAEIPYELILVDDRCPKGSWQEIERLAATDPALLGIRLSRNFGQHAAIQAGLSRARGEWIIVMDCDLQDRPEEVPRLWAKALEGFDVVRAERLTRNDPMHRRLLSRAFYALLSYLTDTHQNPEFSNFGIYHRRVIDTITGWEEESKYFPAIVSWVGFSQSTLAVEQNSRFEGRSSYTLRKLLALGLNIIIGFSDKPLKLVMVSGFVMALLSFGIAFFVLVAHMLGTLTVQGWASMALSLWFVAGCLMFSVGLTGLYVGRILVETKGRPTFIVDREIVGRSSDIAATGRNRPPISQHVAS
jgi:dolichol-phosphate mannosyltransferase